MVRETRVGRSNPCVPMFFPPNPEQFRELYA